MFSKRFSYELSDNPLTKLLNKKNSLNEHIIDLTISNPTKAGFSYDDENILSAISQRESVIYNPNPKGLNIARNAVCNYYNEIEKKVNPDSIFLTSGTSEAYSFLFKLLTDPDDEILIPFPSYPLIDFIGGLENVKAVRYPLKYDGSWYINFDKLKSLISPKTKAIIIINPNNPTGSYIKTDEVKKLNEICLDNRLAIISDEVFYDYILNAHIKPVSLSGNNNVLTFVLNGLSKICALPQFKLSWIQVNAPDNLYSQTLERLEIITDTFLTVGTPVQLAVEYLISEKKNIQGQIIKRIKENLNYMENIVSIRNDVTYMKPDGGWYAVIKLNNNIPDEERVLNLLEKHNVYIHPGYFYDFEEDGYLVLSLITPVEEFKIGMEKILNQ